MPILDLYKSDFHIITYDQDSVRGEKIHGMLKKQGYNHKSFSNREALNGSLKESLPHIIILHYQPLNLEFHELLQELRKMSDEVEIVVLSGSGFWPGINKLLKTGLIDDFWLWPPVDGKVLSLRLNQLIEKTIFKFIAEQRSRETSLIVDQIEDLKKRQKEKFHITNGSLDLLTQTPFDLKPYKERTETELVTHFIEILKGSAVKSEFVYLRNYPPRSQLLVMGTSFSSEKHRLGHHLPFDLKNFNEDQSGALKRLNLEIKKIFHWGSFLVDSVEFADDFYGFLVAFNFDSLNFLKRMARYLSIHLRNLHLEKIQNLHGNSSGKHLPENLPENKPVSPNPLKPESSLPAESLEKSLNSQKKSFYEEPVSGRGEVLGQTAKTDDFEGKSSSSVSDRENFSDESKGSSKNSHGFSENHENLKKTLSSEIERSRFLKSPLSLVICHLSFLYDQNETMEKSLELIKSQLHSHDRVIRIGFSRMGFVFPHCSFKEAAVRAETFRRQLTAKSIETNNPALRLCFGVSEFPKWSGSGESLFATAGKACNRVFHSGKNKVCLFSEEMAFKSELSI